MAHPLPDGPGPTTSPSTQDGRAGRRWTVGRVAVVLCVIGLVAMWAYALSGVAANDVPGRLDDRTFGPRANPFCVVAKADIATLPRSFQTPEPDDRAEVVDQGTARLRTMVAELRALDRPTGTDGEMIEQWLDDWETYLTNRDDYTARLRVDRNARLYVTQREADKRQITLGLDRFAAINKMPDCATPDDVA